MATALSTLTLVLHARNNTQHAFGQVQHQASGLHERLKHMGESLKDFVGVGAGVAVFQGLAESVHELPKAFLEAANAGQQFSAQLQSYYGSQENANKILEYGNQFAIKYGLSIDSTRSAIAALASTGQDVSKLLPAGANIAAALHTSLPDFTSAFNKAFVTGSDRSLRNYLHMTRAQLQAAGVEYDKHGKIISSSLAPALEHLAQTRFGDAAARQAQTMGGQIQSLRGIWETFKETAGNALIKGVQGPLTQVVGWLKNHQALVAQFATTVGSAMGKVAQVVVHFGLAAWPLVVKGFHTLQAAWPAVRAVWTGFAGTLGGVISTIARVATAFAHLLPSAHGVGSAVHNGAGAFRTMGTVLGILIPAVLLFHKATGLAKGGIELWNTATKMWTLLTKAQTAATTLTTAEQEALNVAMRANVIGIVVTALAALVVGVIYAYNHVKVFHDFVNRVWSFLQGVFGPILHTIGDILRGAFSAAWHVVTTYVQAYWHVLRVVWQLIKDNVLPILKTVGAFLGGVFKKAWQDVTATVQADWDLLKKLWDWLNSTFQIGKIGEGIKKALGGAFDFVKKKIDAFIGGFEKLLKGLEHLPGMGWIKGALDALSHAKKEVAAQDKADKRRHVQQASDVVGAANARERLRGKFGGREGDGSADRGTTEGGLPKPKTAPGTTGPSAVDVAKHLTSDFSTALTLFRSSGGLDPADVKRMQADIAALRKTDPDRAAKMQAQLDGALAHRREAIRHHGAVEQHHRQQQAHHAQVVAQRQAHHAAIVAHHAATVAHQAALRANSADTGTLLRTIHTEIREHRYAQAARDIKRYHALVEQGDILRGLDPARAKADADARARTLSDDVKRAQHQVAAVHVAAYKQAGFDLTAGVGYGQTQVGMGPLRDALVEQLRQQIAQQMAQIKELQAQNQHLVAIEHNTRGTHDETKKVVGHTKPPPKGGAHSFSQRHGVPLPF